MAENIALLADCMEVMRGYPDKYFDLAVVDPPYGGGYGNAPHSSTRKRERERERETGLCGGAADFEHRKRSRFGGLFDGYHIGGADGRDVKRPYKKTDCRASVRTGSQ